MFVIPMGTDAPIYHWPRATVALMVLNVVLCFAVPPRPNEVEVDEDGQEISAPVTEFDTYALELGNGLHPVQWVTHNFLHYGFLHLLGNMVFLWAFGIVVEGKLGVLKYLAAYLAIGTLHGAFTQLVLLRSGLEGHAAGASAVVYGLLAICMIWAPRNELNCLVIFFLGFRIWTFDLEVYYTTVALYYVGEQVLSMAFGGMVGRGLMVSQLGHLSGAFWGAVVGIVFLKTGLVDCENWDIITIWSNRRRLASDWKKRGELLDQNKKSLKVRVKKNVQESDAVDPAERSASAVRKVQRLIESGDFASALSAYDKAARTLVSWPAKPDHLAMIKEMHAKKAEADSIRLMRDYCRHYPDDSTRMQLKLAHVLIRDRQRPTAAIRVLNEIPEGSLPPDLYATRLKLMARAQQMQEEGVLELEGDD
jgi:membrane associated rhomboid family serine protease